MEGQDERLISTAIMDTAIPGDLKARLLDSICTRRFTHSQSMTDYFFTDGSVIREHLGALHDLKNPLDKHPESEAGEG